MKRLKKRTTTRKRHNSPANLASIIIEAIIVLSLGLGFIGFNLGISAIQILVLLVVDIAIIELLIGKSINNEILALFFSLLIFIGPLAFIGKVIVFIILLITLLKKTRVM